MTLELSRKERVMRGYHRAMDAFEARETVGSRYVYEVEDKAVSYVPEDNIFVRSTYTVPVIDPVPVPEYYDFMTGIEHMRDGGKLPDWTGCAKAQPIRVIDFSRPLRAKYEAALASRIKFDVLYNPSNLTLRMYPETPIYYSGKQKWHQKMMSLPNRTYVTEVDDLVCHMSFDTIEKEYPENWVLLVPHPSCFKDTYPDGMVEWDGQTIRYTWTTSEVHSTIVTLGDHYYYSTAQTDHMLSNSVTNFYPAQAYWWVQSFPVTSVRLDESKWSTHRPSYTIPVGKMPANAEYTYLTYLRIRGIDRGDDDGYVDLDQLAWSENTRPGGMEIYEEDRKIRLEESGEGYAETTPLVLLVEGKVAEGFFIQEMGFTMVTVNAKRVGKYTYPVFPVPDSTIAVSDSAKLMYEHLLSIYFKKRKRHFSQVIDRPTGVSIPIVYEEGKPLLEVVKEVEAVIGPTTVSQVKAMIRRQGGMVIRTNKEHMRDRFVMRPVFPGIKDARRLWSHLHLHRVTFIRMRGIVTSVFKKQFLDACSHNGLVAWYDKRREEFFVSDPHSPYDLAGSIEVDLEPFASLIYARKGDRRYYYPYEYTSEKEVQCYYDGFICDYELVGLPQNVYG